jgi:hypothetical protein
MKDDKTAMTKPATAKRERVIAGLANAVYAQADPTADPALLDELVRETSALVTETRAAREAEKRISAEHKRSGSYLLGPDTTGLQVEVTLKRTEIPTGIYHLLNPEKDPLVEVKVKNCATSGKPRRVRVTAFLEGLSAQAVRTFELPKEKSSTIKLLPVLPAHRSRRLTEVQWSALHVQVEDLDGKLEQHDTYPILCLARTSGFPSGLFDDDLSRYFGAWVTPNAEPVQQLLRSAAEQMPGRVVFGYARHTGATISGAEDEDPVTAQVRAIYEALKAHDITYVRSSMAFGAPRGTLLQRARLPRETLRRKVANCLDGTVLFASLLEAASLHAALVFVPRHAFVGWEKQAGSGEWAYLETTMIRDAEFEAACRSGTAQLEKWEAQGIARQHSLPQLRDDRIWPME